VATNSNNVRVGVSGQVLVGEPTATAPTGTGGETTGYNDLGFVSEDGVTETRDRSSDTIKAWQNAATVRTVVTDATLTYALTLIETKRETVELYYGTEVTATEDEGELTIVPANTGGRKRFIIDVIDGDEVIRTYVPAGEVTEVGDKVYASGEPVGYEITITAYPDASIEDAEGNAGAARVWATALAS
jgi:hypothetical protein